MACSALEVFRRECESKQDCIVVRVGVRGSKAQLHAAVDGKLVEMNERLAEEPGLLQSEPDDGGFLLIVQPRWAEEGAKTVASLTDESTYAERLDAAGI
eukprot:6029847-Amphidinium_carterae.1